MTALVGSYVEDFKGMAIKATQYQDATGAVLTVTANAGATTDNAIARFDSTAGAIQNSAATVSDTTGAIACGPVTTTGTGGTVFNSTNVDCDFTVKALTSGNAIVYDSGADTLTLCKSTTATTVNGGVTFADGTTDVDIASHDSTNGLKLGGVLVTATAAEINALHTASKFVAGGSTLSVTAALHAGKIIKLDTLAGCTCTLPAASGTGNVYRFLLTVVATSNNHIIKVANGSDAMCGIIETMSDDPATVKAFAAISGTSDTITLNRTTTGSTVIGEWIEVTDIASNLFHVKGLTASTGTEATPFSATV